MNLYASTCISGLENPVSDFLKEDISDLVIENIYDGLIIYNTPASTDKIQNLRFINNTFFILKIIRQKDLSFSELTRQIIKDGKIYDIPKEITKGAKNFRIVISKENALTKIDNHYLIKIENYFSVLLKLKIHRANPDLEIWIIIRSEGFTFIGIRISKHANYEKVLHKGELHPQIANIMCRMANIHPTDTVLDPFAGYGAIPLECANHFNAAKIFAGEKDKQVYFLLKEKLLKTGVVVGKWDGLNNNSFTNGSIDKIITDPPWGQFREISEINTFYRQMLTESERLLKPSGLAVVLTAQKGVLVEQLKSVPNLTLNNRYDILLSGKKAGVFLIKKE